MDKFTPEQLALAWCFVLLAICGLTVLADKFVRRAPRNSSRYAPNPHHLALRRPEVDPNADWTEEESK